MLANVARNGVTSAQDNSAWEDFQVYQQLKEEGKTYCPHHRVVAVQCFAQRFARQACARRYHGPLAQDRRAQSRHGWPLGSRAAVLEPYSDDPSTTAILTYDPDQLRAMAIERDKAGFQLNFHAIGDRANRLALDVFAAVLKANGARDRRDRIEHAQVIAPTDFQRFKELKVIASMQPSHQTTDTRWAEDRIGAERIKGAYAWKTMLRNGVRLAFGTDYPVEPISPFRGLYACVTRERPNGGPRHG